MGIEASYRRVTPEEFEKLHNDAAYAKVYFGEDLETDEEINTYFEALSSSDRYLNLDKQWQLLHFLFTGDFPYTDNSSDSREILLHKMFMGGTETPWEATYSMVRYLTASEVNEIAEALQQSQEVLKLRLGNLLRPNEKRSCTEPYLLDLCDKLVRFFNDAAREGNIVLLSFD